MNINPPVDVQNDGFEATSNNVDFFVLENELAERLRKHCTPWGIEKNIYDSAGILVEIGKLYLQKAIAGKGIPQKINFIKSATLLAGARVRYEKLCNATKIKMARGAFDEMGDALLEMFNASFKRAGILQDLSDQTVEKLTPFREEHKKFCKENLFPILGDLPEETLREEQEKKIDLISNLMEQSTGTYTAMMKGLSQCSLKILGPPPCKFALVGLGSLGRSEVTLYSDFEHVIVLEEFRPDENKKLEKAKEYFRWYSVVFQVIVIGMGETRIPSVGVESLNDLYSTDKSKNWFFDAVTPGGISFDGRFPHASKTPLGKQEASAHRKHVVELIQTVKEMLKFLESEEDLKNGYHLREMLLKTCYVDGNEEIYNEFQEGVSNFLRGQDHQFYAIEQMQFVAENKDFYMNKDNDTGMYQFHKVKDVFYRPVSTAASCFSLFWDYPQQESNFASLQRWRGECNMEAQGLLNESSLEATPFKSLKHAENINELSQNCILNLQYALAVACEIRVKLYAEANEQKSATPAEILHAIVSKRCRLRTCRTVLYFWLALRQDTTSNERDKAPHLTTVDETLGKIVEMSTQVTSQRYTGNDVKILRKFTLENDAFEVAEKLYDSDVTGEFADDWRMAHDFINAAARGHPRKDELHKKALEIADRISTEEKCMESVMTQAVCYYHESFYSKATDVIDDWLKSDKAKESEDPHADFVQLLWIKVICMRFHLSPEELLSRYSVLKKDYSDPCVHIISEIGLFFAHVKLKDIEKAEVVLKDVARLYTTNSRIIPGVLAIEIHKVFLEILDIKILPFKEICEDILQISSAHIQLFSIGNQQWLTDKFRRLNMSKKLGESDYSFNLALLNQDQLMRDYSDIPKNVLHRVEIYQALYDMLREVNAAIHNGSMIDGSHKLISTFRTYSEHLCHSLFVESFAGLAKLYVGQRLKLLLPSTYEFPELDETSGVQCTTASLEAYEQACNHVQNVDLKNGVKTLWGIISNPNSDSVIKNKSCKLLCTVLNYSKFPAAVQCVVNNRKNFLSKNVLPLSTISAGSTSYNLTQLYNDALSYFSEFYYEDSAIALWKVIQNADFDSTLQRKAIMMLQFVILSVWDENGYPMLINMNSVVSILNEKRQNGTGPTERLTEEEQEIFDNLDYYEMLQSVASG